MWYVSTYLGWKINFPRTYVRNIFCLHMCNYFLFTKILCTYLLFVHTWGVFVHMYLFSLFVLMDLVHQFLIIIICSFSIVINQPPRFQQDSRSMGSSETLILSCRTSATWCSRAETVTPVSTLLALNQTGEHLHISTCVNFCKINSLSYNSIVPIDFFIKGINESDLFLFDVASLNWFIDN